MLVVKTHRPEENPPYDKALFLFRNPFHSFLSYYQFILLKDHTKAYKEGEYIYIQLSTHIGSTLSKLGWPIQCIIN